MGPTVEKGKYYVDKWRTDYDFKTFVNSFGSTLVTFSFAVFNGVIGIANGSKWYISIAIYYALLSGVRSFMILSGRSHSNERKTLIIAASLLLLLDTSLGAPLAFLVENQKPLSDGMTMVPAITVAAYTTFKITMAAINQARKKKKSDNRIVSMLRTINFIDAMLSLMVLQNTLVLVYSGDGGSSLMPLIIVSSTAIWIVIVVLSVLTFRSSLRPLPQASRT